MKTHEASARRLVVLAVFLALLAAFPYCPDGGLRTFMRIDDGAYVYNNPMVLDGITLGGVRWAFTTFHSYNWHPLTWLSHMLDASLFGASARGHHFTSVALHALNTALLFLVLYRLTGVFWPSGFAAAFFGVHPLRVESVAWVAERKDVLAGAFFVLLLLAYERYARHGGARRYLSLLTLFALGLMAKPMLVTAPFVLLLLDFWPLGRMRPPAPTAGGFGTPRPWPWRGLIVEKLPLILLTCVASVITFLAQKEGGAVSATTVLPLGVRLANALVAYLWYLRKTVWPLALGVYYPHPVAMPPWWQIAAAFLLLALVSLFALRRRVRNPFFALGWLWFLGMLAPVIGIVQVGEQAAADRYTYLPAIGLCVLLSFGLAAACRSVRPHPALPAAGAGLLFGVLLALTVAQAGLWRDSETLFRHTLGVTSENWFIHETLAGTLADAGKTEEAITHYRKAMEILPLNPRPYYKLGLALDRAGRPEKAIEAYRQALRLNPGYGEIHVDLGVALVALGRVPEALAHYQEALRLQPRSAAAHFNMGIALARMGQSYDAIEHYLESLRIDPRQPEANSNLCGLLSRSGRTGEAIELCRMALKQRADYPDAHNNLGIALTMAGSVDEGIAHFQEALRLSPGNSEYIYNLNLARTKAFRAGVGGPAGK